MKEIRDLICLKTNYDEMYNENDAYIGTIIIDEANTFEGILIDSSSKKENFVFGIVQDGELIEVYKASTEEDELPRAFKGTMIDGKYRGDYLASSAYYEYAVGECQISVIDPYWYRESGYGEELKVERLVLDHKRKMNKESQELYRTIIVKQRMKTLTKLKKKQQTTQN